MPTLQKPAASPELPALAYSLLSGSTPLPFYQQTRREAPGTMLSTVQISFTSPQLGNQRLIINVVLQWGN